MNSVFSDREALLIIYKDIAVKSMKIKLICYKYFLALKQLEDSLKIIDINYSYNIKLDSNINYFIGRKLFRNLEEALEKNDKDLEKNTLALIKLETVRIMNYNKGVNYNSFNRCRIIREQAKNILLEYMPESEIDEDILKLYPETNRDLFSRNVIRNSLKRETKELTKSQKRR